MDSDSMPSPSLFEALQLARKRIPSCEPPRLLHGPHLQTIAGHLLPSGRVPQGSAVQVCLESADERIASLYVPGIRDAAVHLFHGLSGDTESGYMKRIGRVAASLGYHVYLHNHRGCGTGAGLAKAPYHAGRAEDLSAVIAEARRQFPSHRQIAIGFSLSANALLLLAAGVRGTCRPDVAIAVNGPIDLENTSQRLSRPENRIYDRHFVVMLDRYLRSNGRAPSGARTLREFDELYTAREAGFANRDEYYRVCSSRQYLPRLDIPTLLLTAGDDPFVPAEDYRSATLSASTLLHLEPHGGHLGYVTRGGRRWLDQAIRTYLSALLPPAEPGAVSNLREE